MKKEAAKKVVFGNKISKCTVTVICEHEQEDVDNGDSPEQGSNESDMLDSTTGRNSPAASCGSLMDVKTVGDLSPGASCGPDSNVLTCGKYSPGVSCADNSDVLTKNRRSPAVSCGGISVSYAQGSLSNAVSLGEDSQARTDKAMAVALGIRNRAASHSGWIVIVEYDKQEPVRVCSARVGRDKIDGKLIEPNTWYWFEGGKLQSRKVL